VFLLPGYKVILNNYEKQKQQAIGTIEKIMKTKPTELDPSEFKGSFIPVDVSSLSLEQKKKLLEELQEYAIDNNLPVVLRITDKYLYIGRSYAREVAYFKPPKEVIQQLINDAIEKGFLKGKGLEFYANPNMAILVRMRDGEIEKIVPVSASNVEISFKRGVYSLGKLEIGGWSIPENVKGLYSLFVQNHPESFRNGNPLPYSMFNLMGTAKISFNGMEKFHFRLVIYPGTLHELPLGSEAGIKDDRYNQTTRGCLFIGEGSFKVLMTKDGRIITGEDIEIRKQDIGLLIKKGEIIAKDLELGAELKMRNGKTATLSLDKYGNQVWLDEDGIYVPFDSYNFDFNAAGMPQIVFMPPEYGKSEIVNKEAEGKRLYIDNKLYYIARVKNDSGDETLSVFIFPDRYGLLNEKGKAKLRDSILSDIKKEGGVLDSEQIKGLDLLIRYAKIAPINITDINIKS
jgi:hypothetical protein